METKVLVFVELAVGIMAGFVIWSYVAPMLTSISSTPTA